MNASDVVTATGQVVSEYVPFESGHYSSHRGRALYTEILANRVCETTHGPVLDVGCGVGHFLAAMHRRGIPAVGFDVSSLAVESARTKAGVEILQHDAAKAWPYADKSFDAVTMFDVLEHFSSDRFVLDEANRVLRPGGQLFLVTVNRSSILHRVLGPRWGGMKDPEHVCYYNPEELSDLVRRAGLSVGELRTFFNLGVAGEASRMLRPFRVPGVLVFARAIGDSIYLRAVKVQ